MIPARRPPPRGGPGPGARRGGTGEAASSSDNCAAPEKPNSVICPSNTPDPQSFRRSLSCRLLRRIRAICCWFWRRTCNLRFCCSGCHSNRSGWWLLLPGSALETVECCEAGEREGHVGISQVHTAFVSVDRHRAAPSDPAEFSFGSKLVWKTDKYEHLCVATKHSTRTQGERGHNHGTIRIVFGPRLCTRTPGRLN